MALEVFFIPDIRRQLQSSLLSSLTAARAHDNTNTEYIQGVIDSHISMGLAYGIPAHSILQEARTAFQVLDDPALLSLLPPPHIAQRETLS